MHNTTAGKFLVIEQFSSYLLLNKVGRYITESPPVQRIVMKLDQKTGVVLHRVLYKWQTWFYIKGQTHY